MSYQHSTPDPTSEPASRAYAGLTGAEDPAPREARNGVRHAAALSLSKIADGLVDPKLVLSWLATALGAPAAIVGLFAPIREAGALLPQTLLAARLRGMAQRKWLWAAGAAGQAVAALGMALAALTLSGTVLGWTVCAGLAVLALSRAACSVSYKDIQGRTIAKTRRGAVTGLAGSAASVVVLAFAALLATGLARDTGPVIAAIAAAGAAWLASAAIFTRLEEPAAEVEEPAFPDFGALRRDRRFALFVTVRGLLTATALAPPYFVMLGAGGGLAQTLGALVLASSGAAFVSSYVWGRLADRSSRRVLAVGGVLAAALGGVTVIAGMTGAAASPVVLAVLLFGFMLAYHGVRVGRSTYLVDVAPAESRADYAAIANTAIGVMLLAVGAVGGLAAILSPAAALGVLSGFAAVGGLLALRLPEAEG